MKKNSIATGGTLLMAAAFLFFSSCKKECVETVSSTTNPESQEVSTSAAASVNSEAYQASYFYSYEGSLQTWTKDATDLELGDGQIAWHITPKTKLPYQGLYSLEYYLENLNDAGKIWVEKSFTVPANRKFKVDVSFKFASKDAGTINNFSLLAGASTINPEVAADLTVQGSTNNGGVQGYNWLTKSYSFNVTSNAQGKIWVHIGLWGTWEAPRTYYYDNTQIKITQIP